jgi:biopolymer transport protein ExbD
MHLRRRRQNGFIALNITPLIDVVFQLLVFFMLSTNFARYRLIGVESPQERQVIASSEGAIVIEIGADGTLTFDGDPAERTALTGHVAQVIAIDPNRAFLIRPRAGVTLQDAIHAYDEARDGGARNLSFSRERREDEP